MPANQPKRPTRTSAGRALRIFRALALLCIACEAFYLVAMNAFLSTPLFEKLVNATPDVVDIHYSRGWSFFPTRIHARNLSIRATDSHVEWILRFDEIEFDCSLLALARQQFHVSRARGSGITFRARMKVEAPAATDEAVDYLPPIDSLGPVGFIPSQPPSPAEWDDKAWHLWTVGIDDAIAEHVREVWIEDTRLEGDARVTGAFLLKPMREAFVGPAHVEIRRGSVARRVRVLAEPLTASIDFELARFDPRVASSADLFPRISLSVDAATEVPDVDDIALDLPDSGHVHGRVEVPRLALRIEKGVVTGHGHLEARAPSLHAISGAHEITGAIDLTMDIADGKLAASAKLEGVAADSTITIPHATLTADSADLHLENLGADLHVTLDLPEAAAPRGSRITEELPKGMDVRITQGSFWTSMHVEAWRADERVRGRLKLRGTHVDAVVAGLDARVGAFDLSLEGDRNGSGAFAFDEARIVGEGVALSGGTLPPQTSLQRLVLSLTGARVNDRVASGSLTMDLSGIQVAGARAEAGADAHAAAHVARWDLAKKTLGGEVSIALANVTGRFDPRATAAAFRAAHVDARAAAASLDLSAPSMRGVDYGLTVTGAELDDARALNGLLPSSAILAVESGRAQLSADLGSTGSPRRASGRVDVSVVGGGIKLHETHLAGDLALQVKLHDLDPERAVMDITGSHLGMRNVSVTGASNDESAWSGDLVVRAGTLALAPRPKLDGDLVLEASDAAPILGAIFRDTLPKFVAQLARMPRLSAVTHVLIDPDDLVLSDLTADGGDIGLRATYALRADVLRAAFVVRKGPLSIGVNLDDKGAHVRLFGLDQWYRDHAAEAVGAR